MTRTTCRTVSAHRFVPLGSNMWMSVNWRRDGLYFVQYPPALAEQVSVQRVFPIARGNRAMGILALQLRGATVRDMLPPLEQVASLVTTLIVRVFTVCCVP